MAGTWQCALNLETAVEPPLLFDCCVLQFGEEPPSEEPGPAVTEAEITQLGLMLLP